MAISPRLSLEDAKITHGHLSDLDVILYSISRYAGENVCSVFVMGHMSVHRKHFGLDTADGRRKWVDLVQNSDTCVCI